MLRVLANTVHKVTLAMLKKSHGTTALAAAYCPNAFMSTITSILQVMID